MSGLRQQSTSGGYADDDLSRGGWSRLTFSSRGEMWPVWSPDGNRIAFASLQESGLPAIYQKPANGPGAEGLLVRQPTVLTPSDWSTQYLLFHWVKEGQSRRISAFPSSGSGDIVSLRETAFDQGNARLSPDQTWIAYESNESGTREVYVEAFPSQGQRLQVSTSEALSRAGVATAQGCSSWHRIAA